MRAALKVVLGIVVVIAVLGGLRWRALNKPRDHTQEDHHQAPAGNESQVVTVAFVPVTCHLTCPVTDYASKTSKTGTRFDALRFTEFPPIVEALKARKLKAAFVTVPLAMKMREQGTPIKMVCLGHRDGSQLTIRKESTAKTLKDIRGQTIAIPSPFSNENFFLQKMLASQGMVATDLKLVVLPPPDMVAALAAKAIDGFIVAEPFCGKAELDGHGRTLYYAKDIWPNYISCCLVVHEDLIKEQRAVVADLVRGIVQSGEWAERNRPDAAKLVAPYFRQNEKLLNYVLTQPGDRVTYRNLNPTDEELNRILDMGISLKFLTKKTPMNELLDRSFFPANIEPAAVDMSRMAEIVKPK